MKERVFNVVETQSARPIKTKRSVEKKSKEAIGGKKFLKAKGKKALNSRS